MKKAVKLCVFLLAVALALSACGTVPAVRTASEPSGAPAESTSSVSGAAESSKPEPSLPEEEPEPEPDTFRSLGFVIQPEFEDATPFHNGYAAVKLDGLWGVIDESGDLVLPAEYEEIGLFSENGVAPFRVGRQYGLLNIEGEVVLEPSYPLIDPTMEIGGLFGVMLEEIRR